MKIHTKSPRTAFSATHLLYTSLQSFLKLKFHEISPEILIFTSLTPHHARAASQVNTPNKYQNPLYRERQTNRTVQNKEQQQYVTQSWLPKQKLGIPSSQNIRVLRKKARKDSDSALCWAAFLSQAQQAFLQDSAALMLNSRRGMHGRNVTVMLHL